MIVLWIDEVGRVAKVGRVGGVGKVGSGWSHSPFVMLKGHPTTTEFRVFEQNRLLVLEKG
jgi:hypothetical protein